MMRGSEREREILIRSNRLEEFRQKDDDLANRIHECGETRFLELCFVGWDHYANLDGILCELFHDFCNFFILKLLILLPAFPVYLSNFRWEGLWLLLPREEFQEFHRWYIIRLWQIHYPRGRGHQHNSKQYPGLLLTGLANIPDWHWPLCLL